MIRLLRDEVLLLLEGRGRILDVARRVSCALDAAGDAGAIIGGIATVLHGHLRTTADVDVYAAGDPAQLRSALEKEGFRLREEASEFVSDDVPVHLVPPDQVGYPPQQIETIDDIRVVSLPDLIAMKLHLGSRDPLRAQDLADVIGLIRVHRLDGTFAARLPKPLRPAFRKLAKALAPPTVRRKNGRPSH